MLKTKRRRLYFDIEVSANIGLFWQSGYKLQIATENIIKERAVICICYKWEDDNNIYYLQWDKKQCDKKLLQDFINVANTADELVGHNGDKFDLSWIRTRCLFHNIQMFPSYNTIDTLKVARSKFRFNSNRLDYIGKFLGLGQKNHTNFDLWKDIMLKNDKTAMNTMIDYCIQDVVLLEKVHKALSNHIPAKTHYGVIFGQDKGSCPECGSDDLVINNRRVTAAGTKKIQFICKTCNKMHSKTDK
jgi:DNA polymerase elongation subunit (family B)